ncbi:MAG: ATP-binding protein [Edaphobacter sp.]|uniref:sensor histidine kinase n=1 Tax=Edaphobacter sp. TaxID=1934404 RepID=UPI002393B64E|nr:ATP-binding protein [Edaphobacter sp.]MDE1178462.1 ATP-binding protein [Edaphobacter sp.]
MHWSKPRTLRSRLTLWYTSILGALLLIYAVIVFLFQYASLTRQILHDEVQDVITVEGLLYFDSSDTLRLHQDYFSRPQSRLLVDRYLEVRDLQNNILYSSPNLEGMHLGGTLRKNEGDRGFDERVIRLSNGSHIFLVSHIHGMNGRTLILRLGYSLAEFRKRMLQFFLLLLIAIPAALALAALAGQMIARKALRPIQEMSDRAAGITANNLHDRLAIMNPYDELGRMGTVFNLLLERLEQAFQQLHRFTSDAAHELRTPLASMRTIGEVALTEESNQDKTQQALADMLEEASRLGQTIDSLLLLSQAETASGAQFHHAISLQELISEVLGLLSPIMEDSRVKIVEAGLDQSSVFVRADRHLLRTAFVNVLHNAWKFSPTDSTITVRYARTEQTPATIQVTIEDQGPGISPEDRSVVFERFVTRSQHMPFTKAGTGLGLSIAKLVIERAGGQIYIGSRDEGGTSCVIILPIEEHESQ